MLHMKSITTSLQGTSQTIFSAYQEVSTVIKTLEKVRTEIDTKHEIWYNERLELIKSVENPIENCPRVASKETHRPNAPSETPSQYYKFNITIPALDDVLSEMNTRFSITQIKAANAFYVIPQVMRKAIRDQDNWKDKVENLMKSYLHDDTPDLGSLKAELELWETKWGNVTEEKSVQDLINTTEKSIYPNILIS